jgi:Tol biopolymer transport system component
MVDIARQPAFARQVPWRPIAVLTLILVLLAAGLAFVIGSQQHVPAPFGPARNGLVAYSKDGDIYTADPITGAAKAVVIGPETDLRPVFSLDGTRFAFERKAQGSSGPGSLFVAEAYGTGLARVTPEPLAAINSYLFSPDGREILVSTGPEGATTILVAKSDGSGIRMLPVGTLTATQPAYRAPDGGEVVFVGYAAPFVDTGAAGTTPASGLYAVRPDGTGLRTSAYEVDYLTGGSQVRAYVVSADGQSNRILRPIPDGDLNFARDWSNDGTRLFVGGCHYAPAVDAVCEDTSAVVPVDGNGVDVKINVGAEAAGADQRTDRWAPDDGSILTTPLDAQGQPVSASLLCGVATGRSRPVPWTGGGDPSWQRLAP